MRTYTKSESTYTEEVEGMRQGYRMLVDFDDDRLQEPESGIHAWIHDLVQDDVNVFILNLITNPKTQRFSTLDSNQGRIHGLCTNILNPPPSILLV